MRCPSILDRDNSQENVSFKENVESFNLFLRNKAYFNENERGKAYLTSVPFSRLLEIYNSILGLRVLYE